MLSFYKAIGIILGITLLNIMILSLYNDAFSDYYFEKSEYNSYSPKVQNHQGSHSTSNQKENHSFLKQKISVKDLKITAIGTTIELSWISGPINNGRFFEIERSQDGENFELVGNVETMQGVESSKPYFFSDNNVPAGTQYYRLFYSYSEDDRNCLEVISVFVNDIDDQDNLFLQPEPCSGKCVVSLEQYTEEDLEDAKIKVYDALGNVITASLGDGISEDNFSAVTIKNALAPTIFIIKRNKK